MAHMGVVLKVPVKKGPLGIHIKGKRREPTLKANLEIRFLKGGMGHLH